MSHAGECLTKVDGAASAAPAHFALKALDEQALSAIRGKGGADLSRLPVNLSIILWDEPGGGGSKPHALAANNLGDPARGSIVNRYDNVSIGRK